MSQEDHEGRSLTEEGRLVVQISKALFAKDVDETFRIVGRHMDKHRLKVSNKVIREFEFAGRIEDS
jgi:hypothetical protein